MDPEFPYHDLLLNSIQQKNFHKQLENCRMPQVARWQAVGQSCIMVCSCLHSEIGSLKFYRVLIILQGENIQPALFPVDFILWIFLETSSSPFPTKSKKNSLTKCKRNASEKIFTGDFFHFFWNWVLSFIKIVWINLCDKKNLII